MTTHYQRLTFNLSGKVRRQDFEGRSHLVVPAAILAEGVIDGSAGPVFYPELEIHNSAGLWDHKPAVVYHPEKDGQPISACDPVVLNARGVGRMFSTRLSDGKLRTECWLDEERLKTVDSRVLDLLNAGKQIEVSTGLHADLDGQTEGEHDGKKFKLIARNFRPDHLAILPDKLGAYSVAAGGGLLANKANDKGKALPDFVASVLNRSVTEAVRFLGTEVNNELSFSAVSSQLSELLSSAYGKPGRYWSGYVCDVFPDYCIFRDRDMDGGYDSYWKQVYKNENDAVSLVGEAVQVERVTSYQPVNNEEETKMAFDKKAHVGSLIGNGWEEADRAKLEALPDDVLQKIQPVKKVETPTTVGSGKPPDLTTNQQQPQTVQQFIQNAPPEIGAILNDALSTQRIEHDRLVKEILAYPLNRFQETDLKAAPINNLRAIHAMIPPPAPTYENQYNPLVGPGAQPVHNFVGNAGGPPANGQAPTDFLPTPGVI